MNRIICKDALAALRELPDGCVNLCVTSPPYYGLRDYGVDGQIGTEESPQAYICRLVAVFREVRRVLTDDGTLWLNIADSYAGSGKGIWKGATEKTDCKNNYRADTTAAIHGMPVVWDGIKAKDMIGIPWMLAFALRADGWYLRSDIIWNKTNGLPENVKDRPTKSYEHIFLLTKSPRYYYDAEAIAEPLQLCSIARYERGRSDHTKYKGFNGNQSINEKRERGQECNKLTRNRRDVWNLSTNSYRMDGHFAMFPERLVEPCILAGCPVGGVVLDPFFGSGTTGAVAKRLGRQYIGIDLNPAYCRAAEDRIREIPDNGERELTEERRKQWKLKSTKKSKNTPKQCFSAYRCGSSFSPCLPVARQSASISDAVPFWGQKHFHGFAWWEPRPLRRSVLSDITV